jgi:hypothetical protein
MSYSWGASRGSASVSEVALERSGFDRAGLVGTGASVQPSEVAAPAAADSADLMPEQHRVAAELAPMVEVWQRLLAQHVPDRAGRCRTCTKGGTGLRTTPWPCVIHGIADMARRTYDTERSRAAVS